MKYRIRLWCRDCTGQDPQGCFDGGTEIVTSDDPPYDELEFDKLIDAYYEGHKRAPNGPLEFDIINSFDEEIDIDHMTIEQMEDYDSR